MQHRPLVDYLVARDGPPPRSGLLYDYLLAGDGLWLAAENTALRVRAPVALAEVRGLPALGGACELRHGRLPGALWAASVAVARAAATRRHEVLLLVLHGPAGYRLVVPEDQLATPTSVVYTPPLLAVGETVVLALHSHHTLPAFFSATDDADEQGLGLYTVVGRLLGDSPEVLVRAGAYGHWLPLPWETVFTGTRGVFRDVAFDPPLRDQHAGLPGPDGHDRPTGRRWGGHLPDSWHALCVEQPAGCLGASRTMGEAGEEEAWTISSTP